MNAIQLSNTEDRVLNMRVLGMTRKEIANELCRSELTIKTHFQNIMSKTNCNDEIELSLWYVEKKTGLDIRKLLSVTCMLALLLIAEIESQDMLRTRTMRTRTRTEQAQKARGRARRFDYEF